MWSLRFYFPYDFMARAGATSHLPFIFTALDFSGELQSLSDKER